VHTASGPAERQQSAHQTKEGSLWQSFLLLLMIYQVKQQSDLPSKTTVGPLLGLRQTTTARQASQTQRALAIWVTFVVVIMNNIKDSEH
jgi:hypothetical protein